MRMTGTIDQISFEYEFFPGLHDAVEGEPITDFKTLLLRNSGNDWDYNMFADAMIQTLVSHTNLDTQAYRPGDRVPQWRILGNSQPARTPG